jgi:Tol biopolymer transport system component
MPVHRHVHDKLGSVFAYRSELDAWCESRRLRLEPGVPAAPPPARPARVRAVVRLAAAAAALAGAAAFIALVLLPSRARDPLAEARFTRLSEFAGTGRAAAISREGRLIAFLATREGRTDAWVGEIGGAYRNLTNGALHELTDNPAVRTLGFSPDSAQVSIWVRRPDGSQPGDVNVFSIPVAGGALGLYLREAAEFDWSRDGTRLVYHTTAPGDPLFVREPGAAAERSLYVAPAGVHCHFPLWSPDTAFVYFVRGVPPDDWDIWRLRSVGGGLERITNHHARVSYPVLLDGRTLLYLSSDADGAGPWIYSVDV